MNTAVNVADGWNVRITRKLAAGGIWPAVPALVFLIVFFALPLLVLFSFSVVTVERGVVQPGTFTLEYYWETLTDDLFWRIWWRSFWVGTVSTVLCLIFGYPVAYLYTLVGRAWQTVILVATISPLLTSALVRTYAWMVILGGRRGVINSMLMEFDLIDRPIRFLYSDFSVIVGMLQIHLPFMILPLITVLSARDRNLEHASLGMGASHLSTFLRVTLPLSMPGIIAGFALVFAISYSNFIVPQLLGGGNYTTLAVQVYEFIVVILDWNKGAVLAASLMASCFMFVLMITALGNYFMRWSEDRK